MSARALPRIAALSALAASLLVAHHASAQDRQAVTVVLLPAPAELGDLPELYYDTLRTQVEFHPAYNLNDVPEQSLDDLLLAVGCSVLDAECAQTLGEVLGSELLIGGGFHAEAGTTSVRLEVIDLQTGATIRSRSHAFGDDGATLRQYAALFSRSILYEADASLAVTTAPEGGLVLVNGVERGTAPVSLDGLELGLYSVRVEAEGYSPRTDVVAVDRGNNAHEVRLTAAVAQRPPREPRAPREPREPREGGGNSAAGLRIAGIGMTAAGVAMLGAGFGVGAAKNSTQREFDDLTAQPIFDRGEAESLRDQGRSQAGVATALLISGGVLTAGGAVVTLVGFGRNEEADRVALRLGFNRVDLRVRF